VSEQSPDRGEQAEQDGPLTVSDDELPDDVKPSEDNPLAQPAGDDVPDDVLKDTAGGSGGDSLATRARYGTRNGQRIRPRNWTTEARTPTTAPSSTTVPSASPTAIAKSTASAVNSTAERANAHQIKIRALPPARKRSSTSCVGRRRTSG